jgi:aminopeptidase N
MKNSKITGKIVIFSVICLLSFGQIVQTRPLSVFRQFNDDEKTEKKPLPPINYVRSRNFDQKHIALDLRFDWEKEQTFGIEEFTFSPLKSNFTELNLDAGLMIFNSVRLKNGDDLEFSYDEKNSKLSIKMDKPYSFKDEITIIIDYQTKGISVDNSLGFGGGGGLKFVKPEKPTPTNPRQIWSQGESEYNKYWFPSYDYPNDFRTTELKATVQKPLQVISNGKLLSTKENGDGTRTFHWKMDTPYTNYLTSIVVGEFAEIRGEYEGIPVSTYVYQPWLFEGKITAKRLPAMVKFFSEKLNFKYPYVKYAQTTGNTFNGGMENITATTQTDNMIIDERTELDTNPDGLQAHELAHQWFGNYVTCRDWSEIWLNESFATYMEGLWQLEEKGKDYFLFNDLRTNQNAYYNAWQQGNRRPIVTKHYANPDAVFDTYAYPRGGAVLHMLRKQLGDENFFRALNHYLKSNANQPVSTEDLRIAIEEATGQSVDAFFDQWLYRMGHPVFEVTQNYDSAKSELTLRVKQVQAMDLTSSFPQTKFFQMPVEIEIVTNKGTKTETVFIESKEENTFNFEVDSKPKMVDFDNEGTLIKELKFEKSLEELLYQAKNDGDILGRNWAIQELSKHARKNGISGADKVKVLDFLKTAVISDQTWQLRDEAINKIQEILIPNNPDGNNNQAITFDKEMTDILKKAALDQNSQVRGNAISLLGRTNDKQFAPLFRSAINDKSYFVINQAALALANTKEEEAYFILRKLAQTDSWRNRLIVSGLNALAALEDNRALDLGFKYASNKNETSAVRTAALAIISAVGKDDKRSYPLIFANFKTAFDNNSFQTMFNSLQSLIKLGDPRGQEAFDMLSEKFKDNPQFLGFIANFENSFKKALEKK